MIKLDMELLHISTNYYYELIKIMYVKHLVEKERGKRLRTECVSCYIT